jgi:hypothetical protein
LVPDAAYYSSKFTLYWHTIWPTKGLSLCQGDVNDRPNLFCLSSESVLTSRPFPSRTSIFFFVFNSISTSPIALSNSLYGRPPCPNRHRSPPASWQRHLQACKRSDTNK